MCAGTLSIALGSQLIALVASSADSSPNWSPGVGTMRGIGLAGVNTAHAIIRMLSMPRVISLRVLMQIDILLELLKGML